LQRRPHPDPATYIGKGKAIEVKEIVAEVGADTVIVNDDLAPSQRRALEDVVKVKVIDRTGLILDIFAQHAKSKEGKAQVELAQLEYLLPRLRGWGESMSRQAGGQVGGAASGMGSRGPGETKIELDRRRIHTRMAILRRQIKAMAPAREVRRDRRLGLPNVAILGYTNAGKSSLLNRITGAGVLVENSLFATLDPTVRRSQTPDGREFTVSDTVGFVRDLPHQLVAAFSSTLEEATNADLILHVVDASHPDPEGQISAVRTVLAGVPGTSDVREVLVLNKTDIADPETLMRLRARREETVEVSAMTGEGIADLMAVIAAGLPRPSVKIALTVPYTRGDLVNEVHQHGEVLLERHDSDGTWLEALVDQSLSVRLQAVAVASA
jgi:GTP-binding protein HflX